MRVPTSAVKVEVEDAERAITRLRERLAEHPEWGKVADSLSEKSAAQMLDDGLRSLQSYHTRPVVTRVGDAIRVGYSKLLFYYQNRMSHIPREDAATR